MNSSMRQRPVVVALLATTMIAGLPAAPAMAQNAAAPAAPVAATLPAAQGTIRSIVVNGTQRLEPDTVLSYTKLRIGQPYSQESLDQALRDLYETELFADVQIRNDNGALTVELKENPVINRIVLEGNKRLKEDKIRPEIKLAPRQIYTRSKVRADVARIVELYRRQGRFAATIEPKMVQLDQNRVDIVFEISEGPKSKVRQINIIGNEKFKDGNLRSQMVTKQSRWFRLFSSGTSYDPDRLAYDQQKLRQFYLTEGYADFRVISAVAELTPDKQDFIITYVVEEGDRYKFGDVKVESDIRDLSGDSLTKRLPMKKGDWYNAKQVEDTVDTLSETAGLFGYAFADVSPDFNRDKEALTMGINFRIANAPRVYVERVDINGNTLTQDKVVRREFRLAEGDAFNSFLVKRSKDRINSLGYFQEKLDVEQKPGSAPDRIVLETNVQEKSTGELSLSAGFSSLERFIVSASITQRNFRGKGQELRTSVNYSAYSKSVEVGFTEPYFMDKNIALGGDIYRRDLNSFRYLNNNDRDTTYEQTTTGFQIRAGVPITEYISLALRYSLNFDDVTLDKDTYYSDTDGDGDTECDPLLAGRYLCDAIGKRTTSSVGYSLIYDTRDNRIRPTRGQNVTLNQDFAGLGGDVKYVRTRLSAAKYVPLGGGFIFSLTGEGGYIHSLEGDRRDASGELVDAVRLTDRFFLGNPQIRGFDIRGIGPRVVRRYYTTTSDNGTFTGVESTGSSNRTDDALGGKIYYLARAEIEIPLGSGAREMGLRPSIFADVGAVGGLKSPGLVNKTGSFAGYCYDSESVLATVKAGGTAKNPTCAVGYETVSGGFQESYLGDTLKPRLAVGFGVNWNSPFGPFRIDVAKALLKEPGDDTKLINFNVGTQF
ncbi:outer membrane protein assembly factor BamA [Sphingobium sp. CAP-1]|uniref:outer membrane protein assembly factor BamA n=1 Tax=Sphingobium sp. CAP-1 TaxID=2676077 RepID=UPI0012BB35C3|nr:outer membrane protein assembly factor BamA [Sphingobium sp. CAP-1]QGP78807.1 outer membrane protein assembly factor BamA [Sphingobium sp. CAP-1]